MLAMRCETRDVAEARILHTHGEQKSTMRYSSQADLTIILFLNFMLPCFRYNNDEERRQEGICLILIDFAAKHWAIVSDGNFRIVMRNILDQACYLS